jgi:hypothetical protein
MANQVEPGTMGGAAQEPGSFGGAAAGAGAAGYAASSPDTFGTAAREHGPLAHQGPGGQGPGGGTGAHAVFHGRPVSWVAVSIIMAGFVAGGLALIFGHHGPTWWLFWVGAGMAVVGSLLALATDIFEDWY